MLRLTLYMILSIAVLVAAMSFICPDVSTVTVTFYNCVGNTPLKLDSTTYKNELGQTYTVSKFKYYVGNFQLLRKDGTAYSLTDYFLVNEEDKPSCNTLLKSVPPGEYTAISFTIGVDSAHNCSGAQSGALDPVNAMFWTWNTGYIFLKMEGQSPVSKTPGHLLEFHIGGYKAPYNCVRQVTLHFNSFLRLTGKATDTIKIRTDLSQLFKAHTKVDFSKLSSVTDFHNSTTIADNYQDMFSILNQ